MVKTISACFPEVSFSPGSLNGAVAKCEVSEDRSRADIVVKASRLHLVIEVKVDWQERENQCQDLYQDHADKEGAMFVFLTPNGRKPTSAPEDILVKFRRICFRKIKNDLAGLLEELEKGENKPAGHAAAKTYLQTLEKEFP